MVRLGHVVWGQWDLSQGPAKNIRLTMHMNAPVAIGLVSEEDAGDARMGLAMMTPPIQGGNDHVASEIVVTPEGYVLVNGNRMK